MRSLKGLDEVRHKGKVRKGKAIKIQPGSATFHMGL